MEPITPCRRHGLLVDQELDRQLRAAGPIARPHGEQAGRRTGVANIPNVGAAGGDTADRVAVRKHLVYDTEIAAAVIFEGVQQQMRASILQKQFQSEIERISGQLREPG